MVKLEIFIMKKFILYIVVFAVGLSNLLAQDATKGLVEIRQIAENVFIHSSEQDVDGNLYSSNGLLVRTSEGFVLLDTPWNDEQTEYLLDKIDSKFGSRVVLAIITHSHDDRIGGIRTLIKRNITAVSSALTAQFATKAGFPSPKILDKTDTTIRIGDNSFEVFYPGPGHSRDNITVFVKNYNILFAGCFLKSLSANTIGNVSDADVAAWPASVAKLSAKYPKAAIIVPGHGPEGDSKIYSHTTKIIDSYTKSQKKIK